MPSPLTNEWHRSLREQFKRYARSGNAQRLAGARRLLEQQGYSTEEINRLYLEATMRADDLDPDVVPDLDILDLKREEMAAHAAECTCPRCRST